MKSVPENKSRNLEKQGKLFEGKLAAPETFFRTWRKVSENLIKIAADFQDSRLRTWESGAALKHQSSVREGRDVDSFLVNGQKGCTVDCSATAACRN